VPKRSASSSSSNDGLMWLVGGIAGAGLLGLAGKMVFDAQAARLSAELSLKAAEAKAAQPAAQGPVAQAPAPAPVPVPAAKPSGAIIGGLSLGDLLALGTAAAGVIGGFIHD
jgi:hypothetical protein